MAHRVRPLTDPVVLTHDGDPVMAERGEPIAAALIAADRVALARSTKLHRPRGPYCMRGACDGCLARVDGTPNVVTCGVPVRGGERIVTQNVLGSRSADILRATDFLFPQGFDHHRLLAGVRGASGVLAKFARRVAGLGVLPEGLREIAPAGLRDADVLIVGGGAAGLAAAEVLGSRALVADEGLGPGGSLLAKDRTLALARATSAERAGATMLRRTVVAALYREPGEPRVRALLVGPSGAELVAPALVVLASGTHAPVHVIANGDLPGVVAARAAAELAELGVAVGDHIVVTGPERYARSIERALPNATVTRVPAGDVEQVTGRSRVRAVIVGRRKLRADVLAVDGPGTPAIELAVQAGAAVVYDSRGYRIVRDDTGHVAPGVACVGTCVDPDADAADDARRIAGLL